jgi:uncharacterized membrane protein
MANAAESTNSERSPTAHLWAVGFDNVGRAEEVRGVISKLGAEQDLILLDTAVLVRHPDGIVTLDGERFVVSPNLRALTLASFLTRLALSGPLLTATAVNASLGVSSIPGADAIGISDQFVSDVVGLIAPGSSVLFVLDQAGNMQSILQNIKGLGGTVLKATVDLARAKLIQSTLADSAGGQYEPNQQPV